MSIEADPRRAPKDFLPEARRMRAAQQRPHPGDLAAFDQAEAATDGLTGELARSPWIDEHRRTKGDESVIALLLAMEAAGKRRAKHYCPHLQADRPLALQGAFVAISAGIVACDAPCAMSILEATGGLQDDGRCDVCDRETSVFVDTTLASGGLMLNGNLCRDCRSWSSNEPA